MGKIIAIACLDYERGIGKDGKLLFDMPLDKRFFRIMTDGHMVIMGKKTFDSMHQQPLNGRMNIVLTHDATGYPKLSNLALFNMPPATFAQWMRNSISNDFANKEENIFIIGGGSVYEQLMPYCDYLCLTQVNAICEADTFFPERYKTPETSFYPIYTVYDGNMWDRMSERFVSARVTIFSKDQEEILDRDFRLKLNACF